MEIITVPTSWGCGKNYMRWYAYFRMLCFHFCLIITFWFPIWFHFGAIGFSMIVVLINFHIFVKFLIFLQLLTSNCISLGSEKIFGMISIFLSLLILILWPKMINPGEFSVCAWKIMCIQVLLDEMLCICLLGSCGLYCCLSQLFPFELLSGWSISCWK